MAKNLFILLFLALLTLSCTTKSKADRDLSSVDDWDDTSDEEVFQMDEEELSEWKQNPYKASLIDDGTGVMVYEVQNGDTLMLISFKIYGDYTKWRSLLSKNQKELGDSYSQLKQGSYLYYDAPKTAFTWTPVGEPYLIRRGDSLSRLSKRWLGDAMRWQELHESNQVLIKDPDLIFAGFTLFQPASNSMAVN